MATTSAVDEFAAFHDGVRQASPARHASAANAAGPLRPLAFALGDGRAYTYRVAGDRIEVVDGVVPDATVVTIDERSFRAFANEKLTHYGLLYHADLHIDGGDFGEFARWQPALRALFQGHDVYDPTADLLDCDGAPLDLHRSFTLADDPADLAHFLRTARYAHVRNVLSADEVEALRAEVDRLVAAATPGDKLHSWWTKTADGEPAVCQLKYCAIGSPLVTALHDHPGLRAILAATGEDLRPNLDRNEGTKLIIKHPGASEGLTDLPVHNDCGVGFHAVFCPTVLIGVQLERANARGGQLHVLAGSHRSTVPDPAFADVSTWPLVPIDAEPGDCTVHFSHLMHGAPPPAGGLDADERPRRTLYAVYAPQSVFDELEPYEDLVSIMVRDDGVPSTVDDLLA
jgi:hypothetical protein